MKKTIILLFAILISGIAASSVSYAKEAPATVETCFASSSYTITVYMITSQGNAVVATKKSASYNENNNTITVGGSTYKVQSNPYYGDSGKRGAYRYVAGGKYYFNL